MTAEREVLLAQVPTMSRRKDMVQVDMTGPLKEEEGEEVVEMAAARMFAPPQSNFSQPNSTFLASWASCDSTR